jgi:hypothetical protein
VCMYVGGWSNQLGFRRYRVGQWIHLGFNRLGFRLSKQITSAIFTISGEVLRVLLTTLEALCTKVLISQLEKY